MPIGLVGLELVLPLALDGLELVLPLGLVGLELVLPVGPILTLAKSLLPGDCLQKN